MNNQRTARLDALNLGDLYSLQLPGTSVKYSFVSCLHLISNHARVSKRLNVYAVTLGIMCYFKNKKKLFQGALKH